MRLYTYLDSNQKEQVGVEQLSGYLTPLGAWGLPDMSMQELIESGQVDALQQPPTQNTQVIAIQDVQILAPIPRPRQDMICLGINYYAHHEEAKKYHAQAFGDRPAPIYFSKRVTLANGDGGGIPVYPHLVDALDYEAELAVILAKDAFQIRAEDAPSYIFGYTIVNDVSARNLQTGHKQWYFGKSLDGYTPMGPCIVTAEEIAYPPALQVQSFVNGELRQDSNTSLLITGIGEVLEELTKGMTLKAGTIIATGTPAGVGMGFDPPRFLNIGDTVCCKIAQIGTLTNIVVNTTFST